jgi:hypothetical protein
MLYVKYQLLRFLCLLGQFRRCRFKRIIENQRRQHECCAARMRRDIHRKIGGNSTGRKNHFHKVVKSVNVNNTVVSILKSRRFWKNVIGSRISTLWWTSFTHFSGFTAPLRGTCLVFWCPYSSGHVQCASITGWPVIFGKDDLRKAPFPNPKQGALQHRKL